MADGNYNYTKVGVNLSKLNLEILAESFSQVLQWTKDDESGTDNLFLKFAADILAGEVTTLTTLITNHDCNPPTHYSYFCYCCGLNHSEDALSTPTQCYVCSSTDIQSQFHKNNLISTTNPTVDNDDTDGYRVGSIWINVSTGNVFKAVFVSTGAAVWKQVNKAYIVVLSYASDKDVDLAVNTGAHRIPITDDGTLAIKKVWGMIEIAPTGAAIIIDVNKNGTTIFTTQANRPTIPISGNSSGEVTNMDVVTLTKGDYITVDIDQIGSTIPGQNIVIRIDYEVIP